MSPTIRRIYVDQLNDWRLKWRGSLLSLGYGNYYVILGNLSFGVMHDADQMYMKYVVVAHEPKETIESE